MNTKQQTNANHPSQAPSRKAGCNCSCNNEPNPKTEHRDAVEILFGFYKTIPGYFRKLREAVEAEEAAQPQPEKLKEPEFDWSSLFHKIMDVLQPYEEPLWKVCDLVRPVLMEYEDALRALDAT